MGRALAVLTFEFRGFQGRFSTSLPDGVPLLEQQESFARLLRRATHSDPGRRFGSAGEMAEQLTGVLREVLATADGVPRPVFSTVFSPRYEAARTTGPPQPGDPAAGQLAGSPAPARGSRGRAAAAAGGPGRPGGRRTSPRSPGSPRTSGWPR